ncbi:probable L-gulonolactone oxidase 4 isoform X2 [Euphorbia lathyris]|uniref:probable L-gulonolactone oxidase 4 isoform X2 n=1 Tax=Euphorbia lathyris TaxID=212925 RepID=UPI00331426F5
MITLKSFIVGHFLLREYRILNFSSYIYESKPLQIETLFTVNLQMGKFKPFILLSTVSLFLLVIIVNSSPPENPIICTSGNTNCTITNSYRTFPDRSICKAAKVEYPRTEEELIAVVAKATKEKRKIKVATQYSHSIPKLVCPDGEDGLLISTVKLNHSIGIDSKAKTITVESGVTLRQIIEKAAMFDLALPYTPYWNGLTIGGLLSTGAHGSTLKGKGSSVHDYVAELTMVSPGSYEDGYAKVRTLDETNAELDAARVSLGVLGVIYKVTLKLEPMFKRSIWFEEKEDSDLGDKAASFGEEHEFADIMWYPSQRKAIYRRDDRVSSHTSGDGVYEFMPFRSTSSHLLKIIRATGPKFTGYPVIGYQNNLQSSGSCLDSPEDDLSTVCPWDPRINCAYFFQTAFSIRMPDVKSFIQDVQQLVKLEPKSLCVLEQYNGILMRYVKASSAYLGKQEDGIDFDFTYYRSKDPMTPRLYEDILEEIEQIGVFKYQALPHWGKNRNVAFDRVIKKYRNAYEFLKVKEKYDPNGLFSNEWTDQVLGLKGKVSVIKEGCALEGLCICSEDVHCTPSKGYFCKPGKIYKNARVCTFQLPRIMPLEALGAIQWI